jgi:hypothetical protein
MSYSHPVSIGDNGENVEDIPGVLKYIKNVFERFTAENERQQKEHRYHMRQILKSRQPTYAPINSSVTLDSNGNGIMDFGGPQVGRRWVVRMVAFSDAGSYFTTMGSAKVTLCVGQNVNNNITTNMVRWPFGTVPNAQSFGADQMWVVPRDHVLMSVTGGNSGQSIQGVIHIQDFDELGGTPVDGL